METYYWTTEKQHVDNNETMDDFIDSHMELHCGKDYEVVFNDGTYVEIQNDEAILYGVHSSGNGDSFNHKVTFEQL